MTKNQAFRTLVAALALGTLVACGGGGGAGNGAGGSGPGEDPSTPAPEPGTGLSAIELQGRWVTATGVTPQQVALVVPRSAGSADMDLWSLGADFTVARLAVATAGGDGVTAEGKQWTVGEAGARALAYTGTANLAQETLSLENASLLFTRADDLAGGSQLSDVAGAWSARFGGGTVSVSWNIGTNGTISGAGTTGCTYAGQLNPRADVKIFDAVLTETCSSGTQTFSGVATHRAPAGSTPAALTMVVVSTDAVETSALAVLLGKD